MIIEMRPGVRLEGISAGDILIIEGEGELVVGNTEVLKSIRRSYGRDKDEGIDLVKRRSYDPKIGKFSDMSVQTFFLGRDKEYPGLNEEISGVGIR